MRLKSLLLTISLFLACSTSVRGADPASPAPIDYSRDIRPLLSNHCYKCHGFDEQQREAGLRLDSQAGATAKLESGEAAIVPGKRADSALIKRILATDPAERMPPPESGKTLTPEQIELLARWIDEGAEFKSHWSFIKPERPELPQVRQTATVKNAIDRFVQARLEKEGLALAQPADKTTLIRRVTFDLTGLPPTPREIDDFLADDSPEAYGKVVDRLLRSPRHGEHMARYWLDAVRYGDTHGLHFDNERSIWPYRDWVVEAFNANKPFDQFTLEQVAGDLLPEATLEQKIASGFNRCNVSTNEGGSIAEEVLVRYAVDRTETFSTVFLGLTLGCAVCHDHKFDPITQKEFYSLFAFYSSAADAAMDGNSKSTPPVMKLYEAGQEQQYAAIEQQLAAVQKVIAAELARIEYVDPVGEQGDKALAAATEPKEIVWIDDAAPNGAKLQGNTEWQFVSKDDGQVYAGEKASKRTASGLSQHFFTEASPGLKVGERDKLFAYVYLDPAQPPKEIMLQWNDGSWEHRCYWGDDVIPWGAVGSVSRAHVGPLPALGQWVRLEVDVATVGLAAGAVINGWAFTQHDGTVFWDKAGIVTRTPQAGQGFDSLAAWEAYQKKQKKSGVPANVKNALKVAADKRDDGQRKLVRDYFLEYVYSATKPRFDALHTQLNALTKQKTELDAAIPTSLVMADMKQPRETFVLVRGAYDKKGEKVQPGVPSILPPLPDGAPANRLGLAKWLVDPNHPLTARVAMNRFWQQYFGTGIVKTAEDFGSQGSWPTHPELLDYLATEFIASGWDVKHMQRLIVTSATYQQSSQLSPALLARDPNNEWLARGPRFRLDAEAIRDSALAIGGLLVEKPGGRGVRPYQPEGIWEAVAFQNSNTQYFKADEGEGLYRRSLYTFWKRTAPPPSLTTFDAPSREACVVRRSRTNTPLQALVLMNDEQFVEAARGLAQRMLTAGGETPTARLAFAFRLATGRQPTAGEAAVLLRVFQSHLTDYQANRAAAEKLVQVGASKPAAGLDAAELAAYTMAANLILNLDEVVTKE